MAQLVLLEIFVKDINPNSIVTIGGENNRPHPLILYFLKSNQVQNNTL